MRLTPALLSKLPPPRGLNGGSSRPPRSSSSAAKIDHSSSVINRGSPSTLRPRSHRLRSEPQQPESSRRDFLSRKHRLRWRGGYLVVFIVAVCCAPYLWGEALERDATGRGKEKGEVDGDGVLKRNQTDIKGALGTENITSTTGKSAGKSID